MDLKTKLLPWDLRLAQAQMVQIFHVHVATPAQATGFLILTPKDLVPMSIFIVMDMMLMDGLN